MCGFLILLTFVENGKPARWERLQFLIVFAGYFMAPLVSKHHYIIDSEQHFQFYASLM